MKEEINPPSAALDGLIEEVKARQTTGTPPSKSGRKSSGDTRKPGRLEMIRQALEAAWKRNGLDEEPQIVEKVAEAISEGKGITLVGSIGSGKTRRLDAICKALGFQFFSSGEMIRMVRELQEKMGENTGFKMALLTHKQEFSDAKDHALAIDDMGKEPTEIVAYGTRHDYMVEAIEERYAVWKRYGWITIISTQMSPEEIRKRYPAHIADRIGEMTVPVFLSRRSRRVSWL